MGLVGAGKTTVMKKVCDKPSLLRISNDEIREIIKDPKYFDLAIKVIGDLEQNMQNEVIILGSMQTNLLFGTMSSSTI